RMRPPRPAARMAVKAARAQAKVPLRWTPTIRIHASSGNSSSGWLSEMPALLTRTSSRPKVSRAVRTIASPAAPVPTASAVSRAPGPDRLDAQRRLAPGSANLFHHRGGDPGVGAAPVEPAADVVDDDACTGRRERPGVRAAQAAPSAGHDRHPADQRLHAPRYSRGACAVNGVDSAEGPW